MINGSFLHVNTNTENTIKQLNFCTVNKEKNDLDILHAMIKEQWKIDICTEQKSCSSKEDKHAQSILNSTMIRIGDRFESGLL